MKNRDLIPALAVGFAAGFALVMLLLISTGALTKKAATAQTSTPVAQAQHSLTGTAIAPQPTDERYMSEAIEYATTLAVDRQHQLDAQRKVDALASYMRQAGCAPALVDLAPLMVQRSDETGIDCRLAPVTAVAESSGGRGSYDLFGTKGHGTQGGWSWEEQVSWYYGRLREISDSCGFNGDVWHLAWYWYGGGSSMNGDADSYASNVTQSVQSIGW
jgi:hypothetical protein